MVCPKKHWKVFGWRRAECAVLAAAVAARLVRETTEGDGAGRVEGKRDEADEVPLVGGGRGNGRRKKRGGKKGEDGRRGAGDPIAGVG